MVIEGGGGGGRREREGGGRATIDDGLLLRRVGNVQDDSDVLIKPRLCYLRRWVEQAGWKEGRRRKMRKWDRRHVVEDRDRCTNPRHLGCNLGSLVGCISTTEISYECQKFRKLKLTNDVIL